MAITDNITEYECDRCPAKEYIKNGSPSEADWHKEQRVTASGTSQPFVLCKSCHTDYQDYMKAQDSSFAAFLNEKGNKK